MGVYSRFKKSPDGFRNLVQLLETTPVARRQKMIEIGMAEDPEYTKAALKYVLTFEDIIQMSDMELAELIHEAPPRSVAVALQSMTPEVQERFLKNAPLKPFAAIREAQEGLNASKSEIGGAQFKLIEVARKLEKQRKIKTKQIPENPFLGD